MNSKIALIGGIFKQLRPNKQFESILGPELFNFIGFLDGEYIRLLLLMLLLVGNNYQLTLIFLEMFDEGHETHKQCISLYGNREISIFWIIELFEEIEINCGVDVYGYILNKT